MPAGPRCWSTRSPTRSVSRSTTTITRWTATRISASSAWAGACSAGLVDQARFKPEEVELAARPEIYSRFLIEPVRYDAAGLQETEYAIACGSVGGFGGFLSERFRRHDYQLGRRNCQQFLRRHFMLPENNPIFAHWSEEAKAAHRVYRSKCGTEIRPYNHSLKDDDVPHLPIIPLVDDAAELGAFAGMAGVLDRGTARVAKATPPPPGSRREAPDRPECQRRLGSHFLLWMAWRCERTHLEEWIIDKQIQRRP